MPNSQRPFWEAVRDAIEVFGEIPSYKKPPPPPKPKKAEREIDVALEPLV